jgi:hypothetical protein
MNQQKTKEEKGTMFLGLITFAMTIAHYDQKRKNDDKMPYAIHPMMVAMNPSTVLNSVLIGIDLLKARTAALLHDVIEDCKEEDLTRTWDYLQQHVGPSGLFGKELNVPEGPDRKRLMLTRIINYCLFMCGIDYRNGDIAGMTVGSNVLDIVTELTVPKDAHPDGHYDTGDKPARKAWERSLDRMYQMSKLALCVTYNDKLYNMRSPMPGRDPTAATMGYGEYLDNIVFVLSQKHGIAIHGHITDDALHAIELHRARASAITKVTRK